MGNVSFSKNDNLIEMDQWLEIRRWFLYLLPRFLYKDMLSQFQMIQWLEMPKVMDQNKV